MAPPGRRNDLEELLAGSRWVRELARGLVRDLSSAEDVAQDAWLVALTRPAAARDPRAWLTGVVRKLAGRQTRSAERRRRRESAAACGEAVPSTDELVERSELQERLSSAVRALDEPYRTTVLLHYAEGLSLEQIARTQRVPSSTVRTRLARALERLRVRLDREHGDRATWLAAFAPLAGSPALPTLTATSTVAIGSVSMGAKTGLGIAAIAAGIAVLAVTVVLRDGDRAGLKATLTAEALANAPAPRIEPLDSGLSDAQLGTEREAIPAAPVTGMAQAPLLVFGSLTTSHGEPVREASVTLWNDMGETKDATVARGSWSVVGLTPGTWSLRASGREFIPLRETLELDPSAAETRRDLVLEPARVLRIRFVDGEGNAVSGALGSESPLIPALVAVATRQPPESRILGGDGRIPAGGDAGQFMASQRFGRSTNVPPDCAGLLVLTEPPPVYVSAVLRDLVLETRLDPGLGDEMVFAVDAEALELNLCGLSLRLVDARTGAPLEGFVTPRFRDGGVGMQRTGADGRLQFQELVPGLRWLEIDAPEHARADRWIRLEPGQALDLGDVPLGSRRTLKGRVIDEEGRPLALRVASISTDQVRSPLDLENTVHSTGDGDFRFTKLGEGEAWLFVGDERFAANPLQVEVDSEGLVTATARAGTRVILKHGKPGTPGLRYALADSAGRPFWVRAVYGEVPIRLRLLPGSYQLLEGRDEKFALVRTFEVGSETLVITP